MEIIKKFDWIIDKKRIFEIIDCQPESPIYNKLDSLYKYFLENISEIINPIGIYNFTSIPANFQLPEIKNCKGIVFCFLTLGEKVSSKIDRYFANGQYFEALLLDTISNEILFKLTEQLYDAVLLKAKEKGWGVTGRIEPGSENVPLHIQKDISTNLNLADINVSLTKENMLIPLKSITFFCGVGKNIFPLTKEHTCINCSMEKCEFKDKNLITLTVDDENKKRIFTLKKGTNLLSVLKEGNIGIRSSCMGIGTCGKCKIKIVEGELKVTDADLMHLSTNDIQNGLRLACCAYPLENCTVEIVSEKEKDFRILEHFENSNLKIDSIVKHLNLEFKPEELSSNKSLVQIINKKTGSENSYSLNSLVKISKFINEYLASSWKNNLSDGHKLCLIMQDNHILDIQTENEKQIYGIAIDIGTTTLVISLVDLINGKILKSYASLNSQKKYGEDVISRITYSNHGNLDELKAAIDEDILFALDVLLNQTGINPKKVYNMVIAGNTIMQSFLLGLNSQQLAVYPFKTVTTSEHKIKFRDLFKSDILDCEVIILPGISAYVGSDILAGMLYCDFDQVDGNVMLIDIGTNGEIVIGNKEKILCLATAAGPALEGGNITNGIGSVKGAIHKVQIINNEVKYDTVGNEMPIGICGSGVLDIVSTGLENNLIDEMGTFSQAVAQGFLEVTRKANGKPIVFTQRDIREVQLAKSAIRSGMEILIKRLDISYNEIQTVYLAGGFGTNINIESAIRIGMLPGEFKGKIKAVGNSSLGGAVTYLLNKASMGKLKEFTKKTTCIDISLDPDFNDLFLDNMFFR